MLSDMYKYLFVKREKMRKFLVLCMPPTVMEMRSYFFPRVISSFLDSVSFYSLFLICSNS